MHFVLNFGLGLIVGFGACFGIFNETVKNVKAEYEAKETFRSIYRDSKSA